MESPTYVACSFVFPSQETGINAFSLSRTKFKQFFLLFFFFFFFFFFYFSCQGSLYFGQSSKRLSADRLRCEHRHFYMVTSVRLVSYILANLGPRGELLTKQASFLVQPYARIARITLQNFTSPFSPATISLASLRET